MAQFEILLKEIEEKGFVKVSPKGNSMKGRIKSGQEILLVKEKSYGVGDAVLAKVKGKFYVHIIKATRGKDEFQIANNKGFVNGWTRSIYAKAYIAA